MRLLPFQEALGAAIDTAAPAVREHFLQPPGTVRYRGVMRRVWRRGGWQGFLAAPFLWIGTVSEKLFVNTGTDVPFELQNTVTALTDGRVTMTWSRSFHFPRRTRRFRGIMTYEAKRGAIVDWLGNTRILEVELHAQIEGGAIRITSGRQRLNFGLFRLPLSEWIAGRAEVREWEEPNGALGVCVTVSNPLLGAFFGYEGWFRKEG